jgi:hypothetical protein
MAQAPDLNNLSKTSLKYLRELYRDRLMVGEWIDSEYPDYKELGIERQREVIKEAYGHFHKSKEVERDEEGAKDK